MCVLRNETIHTYTHITIQQQQQQQRASTHKFGLRWVRMLSLTAQSHTLITQGPTCWCADAVENTASAEAESTAPTAEGYVCELGSAGAATTPASSGTQGQQQTPCYPPCSELC